MIACALGQVSAPSQQAHESTSMEWTVARDDAHALEQMAPFLSAAQQQRFDRGRRHFDQRWVPFPSLGGDWGLGPTFVTDTCAACHVRAGRGAPPERGDEPVSALLVRLSVPGESLHGGPLPHPQYGDQIQTQGLAGSSDRYRFDGIEVPPEARVFIDWSYHDVTLADGETVELRRPTPRWERLAFGPIGDDAMTSLRLTPPIHGLGLLEAVPEESILAIAEMQKTLGYDGRLNRVYDPVQGRTAWGRFGWKANVPGIAQQIAIAYAGELGVTSLLYPAPNCPPAQKACSLAASGNLPELIDGDWHDITFWVQALAVPAPRNVADPRYLRGKALFEQAQCSVCHVPTLRTASRVTHLPQLADQVIRPYTDLLIHDMGAGLTDGRPDFQAGPRDWRTPPLWGLGLSRTVNGSLHLLHDGRARTVLEAILWHGGEAQRARDTVISMPKADREALIFFVEAI